MDTQAMDRNTAVPGRPGTRKRGLTLLRVLRLRRFWSALLIPVCLVLVHLAGENPAATERIYSTGIYPALTGVFGRLVSLLPFSLTQFLVVAAPVALLVYIVLQTVRAVRDRSTRANRLVKIAGTLVCVAGVGYALFTLLCGLNYHRLSFAAISGLDVRPSATYELADACAELVERANALRAKNAENEEGVMVLDAGSYYEAAALAQESYRYIGGEYEVLGGYTARPKPVIASRAMSYLDITGIYMPFTFEANVNVDVPDYWIPCTMMHELAHFKGFMREDEANFVSYLACTSSGNDDFDYSGTMLALIHSSNALYSADKELYWPVMENLSEGVRRDLAANSAYWKQFEGPVAQASSAMNDAYLKSNKQENGVKSYGRMVDLVLADYRERHGLA